MKKVLFASTALIATAGVAAAEVNFSGYGRFGIGYVEDRIGSVPNVNTNVTTTTISGGVINVNTGQTTVGTAIVDTDDAILVSRFRLNIDGIVETDGGVRFEGRVRLQADEDSGNGEANSAGLNGARFSVIYGGLRVDAGNVAGAFDNLANYYGNEVGLELFAGQYSGVNYSFLGYSSTGSGANAVFFQYAVGDFAFGASYDQATVALNGVPSNADRWDVSATYTFNNITAAVAYGQTDVAPGLSKPSLTVLTLGGEWGDFSGTLFVADDKTRIAATDGTAWGLSAAYNLGAATTLLFTYGDGQADLDTQQVAIGAIYDLGGGASLRGGIGVNDCDICADSTIVADFGAQFNF
ncbi:MULTISPECIES: porin [unclassified Ruegeria]|uniref:porin n=1 Tax=unclassified Ruegeria TaxID=2625375 RepID=UPI001489DDE7|nr:MULTISPECIES: porin [unclassified Ruegeria]NOE35013.1 porin [Ruegeria sp. HKCCD7318]